MSHRVIKYSNWRAFKFPLPILSMEITKINDGNGNGGGSKYQGRWIVAQRGKGGKIHTGWKKVEAVIRNQSR